MNEMFEWSYWSVGFWSLIGFAILTAPFHWYANQVGYDATKQGREKLLFGQVTSFAKYNEVQRLAKAGDRFARATLIVLRVSMVLPFLAIGLFFAAILWSGQN